VRERKNKIYFFAKRKKNQISLWETVNKHKNSIAELVETSVCVWLEDFIISKKEKKTCILSGAITYSGITKPSGVGRVGAKKSLFLLKKQQQLPTRRQWNKNNSVGAATH